MKSFLFLLFSLGVTQDCVQKPSFPAIVGNIAATDVDYAEGLCTYVTETN